MLLSCGQVLGQTPASDAEKIRDISPIHVPRVGRKETKQRTRAYVLADLFRAVRTASKNDLEAIAVIVHLLEHGRVRIITADREVRVRVYWLGLLGRGTFNKDEVTDELDRHR